MTQSLNQFSQTPVLGELDLQSRAGSIFSCQISTGGATAVAGQALKLDTTSLGGVPKLVPTSANSDVTFGFAIFTLKDQQFVADSHLEVACTGSVMYLTSGGSITRGAKVEMVAATPGQVITSGGTNPVVGKALDGASGSGQLIRVFIETL